MSIRKNFLDKAIDFISPAQGAKRMAARASQVLIGDQVRRYEAASKGRRTEGWRAPSTSAPAEIDMALTTLRNRSRDMERNNPIAKNALGKIARATVGTGIVPTPSVGSKPQEKKIKALWKLWAETTACDYDGHLNFYGLELLVMRTWASGGECLVRKHIVNDKSLPIPLQLQVLEGDFIDTTKHSPVPGEDGSYILYGLEFNKTGRVVAYWLYEHHPGDAVVLNYGATRSNRFDAADIIHVFNKERPGQYRGVPVLHASMLRMRDLDEYQDAQLVRQKIAACFSVFVQDSTGAGFSNPLNASSATTLTERVEPGIIQELPPGKQIAFASPPGAEGYDAYVKAVYRDIAAGLGMDYVTLTGDLSAVNFSSGRMGWMEFNRSVQEWQWQMLIPMFCDRAWGWFSQMASIGGLINPGKIAGVTWTPPRREMIDPAKELQALITGVQNGLLTWQDVILEMGYVPEEQLVKMTADQQAFVDAGLPAYTAKNTGTPPAAAPDPADDEEGTGTKGKGAVA